MSASRYDMFPAVKIARFAIDKSLQGKGYGKKILLWCINHVRLIIMPNVGCRYLVLDAKQNSISFYQRFGFVLLDTGSNRSREYPLMSFDLFNCTKLSKTKENHFSHFRSELEYSE